MFSVVDGELRISGEGLGYLATRRSFRDYRLVVEYRWGDRNHGERAGKARDSGIFLHARGPHGNSFDGGGAFMAAIECQVMEGCVGDLMLIRGRGEDGEWLPLRLTTDVGEERDAAGWPYWRPDGEPFTLERWGRINWRAKDRAWQDRLGFRGARDPDSPAREWTRIECVCRGDRILIRVNGELVVTARDVHPTSGKILLQCEGSEIFFRRVVVERLP